MVGGREQLDEVLADRRALVAGETREERDQRRAREVAIEVTHRERRGIRVGWLRSCPDCDTVLDENLRCRLCGFELVAGDGVECGTRHAAFAAAGLAGVALALLLRRLRRG